jgi:hypothetical protein
MTFLQRNTRKGKGNIPINKSLAKKVKHGQIIQDLPLISYHDSLLPLFTVIPATTQVDTPEKLIVHRHYTRHIISSYGIIEIPVTYWKSNDPSEDTHYYTDLIIGVTGSANYSDEYMEKQKYVRYEGKASLWNTRRCREIYTYKLTDSTGRAPCPTTLWNHEQKEGKKAFAQLLSQEVPLTNGSLYIDGYWVKDGWKKYIEKQLGRRLTLREWKKLRYKVIYVVATEDKVILDFQITNIRPSYLELIPLFNRIQKRFSDGQIKKIVSDEDRAIIHAVQRVFPHVTHGFCVFHQLKKVTRTYLDAFKKIANIPEDETIIYDLAQALVTAENVIESTGLLNQIKKISSRVNLSKASQKVVKYVTSVYHTNRKLLEKGFVPETNNVMEQIFSFIADFVDQARSFKRENSLKNFSSNLFSLGNNRAFNTGSNRGLSPLDLVRLHPG